VSSGLQAALRTLLEQPLLLEGMDGFRESYPWRLDLKRWFETTCNWTVQSGVGVLRLVAEHAQPDAGRALSGLKTVRSSAMFAWVLWFHEYLGLRVGQARQFSLGELSEAIEAQSKLSFSELAQRRALLQAVYQMDALGVLRIVDAETEQWEAGDGSGGALLEFSAGAAYLLSNPVRLEASAAQRAARALLVGPALVRADDPAAWDALSETLADHLEAGLGWPLEQHAQYASLLRGGRERGLAERWTPGRSVTEAASLLLLGAIRREVLSGELGPDEGGRLSLSRGRLYQLLEAVRSDYKAHWGEQAKIGTDKLLREILNLWHTWGGLVGSLVGSLETEQVVLEPHLGRFKAGYEGEELEERPRRRKRRR